MTERLYLQDSHLCRNTARVTTCVKTDKGYEIELDRSVFFPNKGGQPCDLGTIGTAKVLDVNEAGDRLVHLCSEPLEPGTEVEAVIDWARRKDIMEQHTGEHLLSWCAWSLYGAVNVGFHCALDYATLDLDIHLTAEQLKQIEQLANRVARENRAVTAVIYKTEEELEGLPLRKHTEGLTAPIRVVTIEGADSCTCCAPHVKHTGEIGLLKITQAAAYKGGMRLTFLCGGRAYTYASMLQEAMDGMARSFSTGVDKVSAAVEKMNGELDAAKRQNKSLSARLEGYYSRELKEKARDIKGKKLLVEIVEDTDPKRLRPLCQSTLEAKALTLLLCPNGEQVSYILMCKGINLDMGEVIQAVNAALGGKGGGRGDMAQGSARKPAGLEEIRAQLEFYLGQRLK